MISQIIKIITPTQENTMSKKFEYKYKLFAKIHQLQKRFIGRLVIQAIQRIKCGLER